MYFSHEPEPGVLKLRRDDQSLRRAENGRPIGEGRGREDAVRHQGHHVEAGHVLQLQRGRDPPAAELQAGAQLQRLLGIVGEDEASEVLAYAPLGLAQCRPVVLLFEASPQRLELEEAVVQGDHRGVLWHKLPKLQCRLLRAGLMPEEAPEPRQVVQEVPVILKESSHPEHFALSSCTRQSLLPALPRPAPFGHLQGLLQELPGEVGGVLDVADLLQARAAVLLQGLDIHLARPDAPREAAPLPPLHLPQAARRAFAEG
mmetsp:Transcript_5415/g.11052  ORF Transcript_5415/g.11052 Transcript_5415/m.11052 type:complete len:259 (-) Transcript_5415:625-1401(-)